MAKMDFFGGSVEGQSDLFSMFGLGSTGTDTASEDVADEVDETDEATEDDGEEDVKPKAKPIIKAVAAATKNFTGPVSVKGCGWSAEVGESGQKYATAEVVKMLFELGYKEVAAAEIFYKGNNMVVRPLSGKASDDMVSVKDGVTIIIGQAACTLTAEQCGVEQDDFALFDTLEKFTSLVPAFAGCSLKYSPAAKVAVPVFDKSKVVDKKKLDPNKEYRLWTDGTEKSLTGADLTSYYEGYEIYAGQDDVIFAQPAKPEKASSYYFKTEDLGLKDTKEKKVEEKYRLPLKICLSNYNQVMEVTAEQFGGKERIEKEDVLNFLRPTYRAFRSGSRKFDFCYNKQTDELAVSIVSGEKGFADAGPFDLVASDGEDGVRIERTPLGTFRGVTRGGEVKKLDFSFEMPKIPTDLLYEIVDFFKKDLTNEAMVQIYYNSNRGYYLSYPRQDVTKVRVSYTLAPVMGDTLVMTVHSHNTMSARFSFIDDEDEVYTGLFGVIGRLDRKNVEMTFRAGMEGCFKPLIPESLFGGAAA